MVKQHSFYSRCFMLRLYDVLSEPWLEFSQMLFEILKSHANAKDETRSQVVSWVVDGVLARFSNGQIIHFWSPIER